MSWPACFGQASTCSWGSLIATLVWIAAALAITTALTVQGIGILLPTNLRVYLEMRRPEPDGARIGALMRRYVRNVALQGAMQIAIIVVMARFVTGL